MPKGKEQSWRCAKGFSHDLKTNLMIWKLGKDSVGIAPCQSLREEVSFRMQGSSLGLATSDAQLGPLYWRLICREEESQHGLAEPFESTSERLKYLWLIWIFRSTFLRHAAGLAELGDLTGPDTSELRLSWLTGKSKEWCFTLSFSLGIETQGKKRFYHFLPLPSSSTGTSTTPRAALVLCVPPWLSKANAGSWDGATALCEEHGSHCCNKGAGKVNTCFYFAGNMLEYSFCHSYLTYFASKERIARAFWNKLFLF